MEKPASLTPERAASFLPKIAYNELNGIHLFWESLSMTSSEARYIEHRSEQTTLGGIALDVLGECDKVKGLYLVEAARGVLVASGEQR